MKNIEFLRSVFEATVFNSNLIDISSQNNLHKITSRFKDSGQFATELGLYFSVDEREKFENFLRNWLEENQSELLYILDPYFTEKDLDLLKIIKEVSPNREVFILTSKQGGINKHDNNEEIYRHYWQEISAESPPLTSIKIVWQENNLSSPFHDRWWILDNFNSGLHFGSSYGTTGVTKDTQISIMSLEDIKRVEDNAIRDFLHGNVRKYGNDRLKYSLFELD